MCGLIFMGIPLIWIWPFFVGMLYPGANISNFVDEIIENWFVFAFCSFFIYIGAKEFLKGIKVVSFNASTKQLGVETYGYIKELYQTRGADGYNYYELGIEVLEKDNAIVERYLPAQNRMEAISMTNGYVKIRYYKGEVEILEIVDESNCPKELVNHVQKRKNISKKTDTIIIDGIEYIKID